MLSLGKSGRVEWSVCETGCDDDAEYHSPRRSHRGFPGRLGPGFLGLAAWPGRGSFAGLLGLLLMMGVSNCMHLNYKSKMGTAGNNQGWQSEK